MSSDEQRRQEAARIQAQRDQDERDRQQQAANERRHREEMEASHNRIRKRDEEEVERKRRANEPHCFAAETAVSTAFGTKEIATLVTGDFVLAYCQSTGETVERRIKKCNAYPPTPIWEITTRESSVPIRTTRWHQFLTDQGWKRSRALRAGDLLKTVSGWATIVSSRQTAATEPVFNLVVEDELTFIANGVVTHSFSVFRTLRAALHRIQLGLTRAKPVAANG